MNTLAIITVEMENQHKDQKELMDFLGLQKTAFSDWKSGKSASYEKYLPQIADFLGVSIDYLAGRTTKKEATLDGSPHSRELQEILDGYVTLNDANRQVVRDLVASLTRQQGS